MINDGGDVRQKTTDKQASTITGQTNRVVPIAYDYD